MKTLERKMKCSLFLSKHREKVALQRRSHNLPSGGMATVERRDNSGDKPFVFNISASSTMYVALYPHCVTEKQHN